MADQNDLTTNVTLYDENGNPVDIELIDGKYRLHVKALIDSDTAFQLQAFEPKMTVSGTSTTTITSAGWTTLLTRGTGERGKLDFVAVVGGSSGYKVRLTVDGTQVFDVSMSELANIGLSNATNVAIWAETANKNFRYHPKIEVDYTDSILVEAQATGSDVDIYYLVAYRVEVT